MSKSNEKIMKENMELTISPVICKYFKSKTESDFIKSPAAPLTLVISDLSPFFLAETAKNSNAQNKRLCTPTTSPSESRPGFSYSCP